MTLKTIATGSTGNCYILTSDSGKHLILDAGTPIAEIKKGLDFDVENIVGAIVTHCHNDHSLSVGKLRIMGIPTWCPYYSDKVRQKTRLNEFEIECFDVPHNGCECRAFLITVDGTKVLYCTDAEYIPYDLKSQKINVMLIECNYMYELVKDENTHREHIFKGHMELETTLGVIKGNMKHLRKVILCHMSMSGSLDRDLAMERIREAVPEYIGVEWAIPGTTYNISEIPF